MTLPQVVIPACRHAVGTISSSSGLDVWRMVSEDSDELISGLATVHRFCDAGDLDQTLSGQMPTARNQSDTTGELLEVVLLRRHEPIAPKERDDDVE
jgi:hypothetical protein